MYVSLQCPVFCHCSYDEHRYMFMQNIGNNNRQWRWFQSYGTWWHNKNLYSWNAPVVSPITRWFIIKLQLILRTAVRTESVRCTHTHDRVIRAIPNSHSRFESIRVLHLLRVFHIFVAANKILGDIWPIRFNYCIWSVEITASTWL